VQADRASPQSDRDPDERVGYAVGFFVFSLISPNASVVAGWFTSVSTPPRLTAFLANLDIAQEIESRALSPLQLKRKERSREQALFIPGYGSAQGPQRVLG